MLIIRKGGRWGNQLPELEHLLHPKFDSLSCSGDTFVITIPKIISKQFEDCLIRIYTSGNSIILESGCKLSIEDINTHEQNCYYGVRAVEYSASGRKIFIK